MDKRWRTVEQNLLGTWKTLADLEAEHGAALQVVAAVRAFLEAPGTDLYPSEHRFQAGCTCELCLLYTALAVEEAVSG